MASLGHDQSLAWEPFPEADPALLVDDTIEIPVQVNGKVRGHVTVAADADAAAIEARAGRSRRRQGDGRQDGAASDRGARPHGQRGDLTGTVDATLGRAPGL